MKSNLLAILGACLCLLALAAGPPAHANDTLAKVRADMATAALNQAQVDKAQTAATAALDVRVKAVEAAAAALQAQQATAAQPATPAPARIYPTTVAAKSAQPVWDLQFRAAPVTTKNLLTEVAAGHALPPCWSFDPGGKVLYITCDSDTTGWSTLGARIYNQGPYKLVMRSCAIGSIDTLDYAVRNGDDGGTVASVMELYGCRVFGKNTAGLLSSWSTVNSSGKAIFRAFDTDWVEADYRFLSASNVTIDRNWFGRVAVQTSPGAHIEALFAWNGWTISNSLIDETGSAAPGASGNMMAVGGNQILTGNIFRGAAAINAYVAMQGGTGITWALNDNIIEPGLSHLNSPTGGYIATNGGTAPSPKGNVDFATGASIDAAIAAAQ